MPEILIVGAGPAGMAAAVSAASRGARVTVLDDNPGPGGQIWRGGDPRVSWFARLKRSGAELMTGARIVSGDPSRHTLLVEKQDSAFTVSYEKLILATGARELFLPFPGWTSPNVMGVGGLQALVKSGLSVTGKKVIVAGTGPFLLAAASYLRKRGAIIPLIAEQTPGRQLMNFAKSLVWHPAKLLQAAALRLQLRNTRYLASCWVKETTGSTATLCKGSRIWQESFDYLATGYGFRPNVELAAAMGCALADDAIKVDERQRTTALDIYAAGECTGIGGVDIAVLEGQIAGLAASGQPDISAKHRRSKGFARALNDRFKLRPELRSLPQNDTIVCRCEDVRLHVLQHSRTRREAKLYTRCGMGPCQGRICGPILDFLQFPDRDTARTPVFPARLETLVTKQEITQE